MDAALTFGPAHGCRGDRIFIPVKLSFPFQGKKLIAEDSAGASTCICQLYVDGQKTLPLLSRWRRYVLAWAFRHRLPRPLARILRGHPGAGMRTSAFTPAALGNDLTLPTCPPGKEITVEVEFLARGTWRGELVGTTVDQTSEEVSS